MGVGVEVRVVVGLLGKGSSRVVCNFVCFCCDCKLGVCVYLVCLWHSFLFSDVDFPLLGKIHAQRCYLHSGIQLIPHTSP